MANQRPAAASRTVWLPAIALAVWVATVTLGHAADAPSEIGERPAAPRSDQFVGITKCAACHFKQFESWKTSPHGKSVDYLPAKYRQDAECLACHSGQHARIAVEQNRVGDLEGLPGIGCEDCHGPGREHANLALSYMDQRAALTEEAITTLRSKIQKTAFDQCIKCHITKAHKEHPTFERDKTPTGQPEGTLYPPRRGGFLLQGH